MRTKTLLASILAVLPGCNSEPFTDEACLYVPEKATSCPSMDDVDVDDLFIPFACGDDLEITEVTGPGERSTLTHQDGSMREVCCYPVKGEDHDPESDCIVGRPYYENGSPRSAPLRVSSRAEREPSQRALAWARAGAAEHASVAAFGRLALELMAHGAPLELLRDVHQAALDELGHAAACWSLAERFGGRRVSAGAFPFEAPVAVDRSLAELVADAVREGCLAETLGAHVAEVAAELAPDDGVRAALAAIAREEATHAVLSFRIVAWALRLGGDEVRAVVREAAEKPWPRLDVAELAERADVEREKLEEAARRGVAEVLRPAMARLLAA